jgi:SOS-response transcriptional repressor LexA
MEESEQLSNISVHAGFPNPATDSDRISHGLSLDQLLVQSTASTYMFRLQGHAWAHEGIADGDIAVVDRALSVRKTDLVIAWENDVFLLVRAWRLPPGVTAWGVVRAIIHHYRTDGA